MKYSILLSLCLLAAAPARAAVTGNIHPAAIEIDASANLYPSGAAGLVDWVKDSLPNTDEPSLTNSIASGLIPNVTAAVGGTGHWYGCRIVDGIASADQDIFLTGGKENDLATWNIGPGSVGSSKYDITQAYLANNRDSLFFGMERRGNNGTTAFDFEFNQYGPNPATPLLPTRTIGDVLFTFELSGSGSSGQAVPHYYIWNGSRFVEQTPPPASLVSSINQAEVDAAPWGYVNSKGVWALGKLPRFCFAEASVKLSEAFPHFTPCGNSAFVQVRTRSSATDTSDLKDTTRIFEFRFGGPDAVPAYGFNCFQQFTYDGTASLDSGGGHDVTYLWNFLPAAGVTLSGTGLTGPDAAGVYHSTQPSGIVHVTLPPTAASTLVNARLTVFETPTCSDSSAVQSLTILRDLAASIVGKAQDGTNLSVTLSGEAPGATSLQWQRLNGATWVNIPGATNASLTYANFETDATPGVQDFTIDGAPFSGKLWQVQVRLHAERLQGSFTCEANSSPVTLKKVTAVDP
ncbi:MAG: hypothetical protein RJA22_2720 [Verrucomicrobiota bacterium]